MARRDSEVSLCIKYLLFFFNIFFWLVGGIILGVGLWARIEKTGLDAQNFSGIDMDPAIILITVGIIMFLLGFCGCVGALRENIHLLKFFSISLSIIFFLQLAAGVIGFVFRIKIREVIAAKLKDTIPKYRDNPDLQNLIDYSQSEFRCCGLSSYDDWERNVYFNCSSKGKEACGVPFSCCKKDKLNSMCGFDVRRDSVTGYERGSKIFTRGCIEGISEWFKSHLVIVGGVGVGVAVLQVLGIAFATTLMSDIRRQVAKWDRPPLLPRHYYPDRGI